MFKNKQQEDAYNILKAFLHTYMGVGFQAFEEVYKQSSIEKINPEADLSNRIVVSGMAGVGKTWLIHNLINYAKAGLGIINISVAANTNQAKNLLAKTCGTLADVCTLTKFFKLSPSYDKKGELKFSPTKASSNIKCDLLIVDEASQYDMDELEKSYLPPNTLVIYLGDICQTPPIGLKQSKVFNYRGFVMDLPIRYDYSIGEPLSRLRESILNNSLVKEPFILKETIDKGKGICYSNTSSFKASMLEDFKYNPLTTKLLCFTNEAVETMNGIVKKHINPSPKTEPFIDGDVVMSYNSYGPIDNGDSIQLSNVSYGMEWEDFPSIQGLEYDKFDLEYATFQYPISPDNNLTCKFLYKEKDKAKLMAYRKKVAKLKDALGISDNTKFVEACKKLGFTPKSINRRNLYWNYIDKELARIDSSFITIKMGYCMTIHKAQGQGFNNVYIYSKDLEKCIKHDPILYKKLLYTGATRSKSKLILSK